MKKNFKRTLAVFLAVVMTFGIAAVGFPGFIETASAQTDEYELTIKTKCFYTDEYGELIETQTVLPGENVKFRVYVGTNYVSTDSTFMFFFEPDVFTDGIPYNTEFNLNVNPLYVDTAMGSVVSEATAIKIDSQNARLQRMVSEGYIDADYVDAHEAYIVSLMLERTPGYIQYDAEEWLFEFDMVATENIDAIGSLEIHQGAFCSPDTPRGYIDVPVVTDIETPLETSLSLAFVEVSTCFEFWNITVKESVPVIFYASGGCFEDGANEMYIEHPYGETLTVPNVSPTKYGYMFVGWTQEEGSDILVDIENMTVPIYGVTFYAVYVPCDDTKYTVNTYMMNIIGEYEPAEAVTYTAPTESTVDYLPPEIEGFTVNADLSTLTGVVQGDGSLLLEVYYDRNKYVITFDNTYETFSEEYYYGEDITEPEIPVRPGYIFEGWVDGEENFVQIPYIMPAEDVTFTAVFSACHYNVYYELDGGCFPDGDYEKVETHCFGEEIPISENPEKEGYSFVGWVNGETGEEIEMPFIMPEHDVILQAVWTVNEYDISFDDGSGNEIAVYRAEYGTDISQIVFETEIPEKYGYLFAGWIDKNTGEFFEEGMIMPACELRFIAVWNINEYRATWISDGEIIYEAFFDYGSVVDFPEGPEKIGYTFEGWADSEGRVYSVGEDYIMPGEDVVFQAVYISNTDTPYTVEVYIMETDGCYPDEASETYLFVGDTDYVVTVPEEHFSREGFALDTGKSVLEAIVMADGSTVLRVYLERLVYTLNIDIDGSAELTEYYYGSIVAEPEHPEKVGCYFDSWVDENGENINFPFEMPAEDVTIKAEWVAVEYTVTFDAGEGEFLDGYHIKEYIYCYGDETETPEEPFREGYVFVGWTPAVPTTMPAENMEFAAVWEANDYIIRWIDDGIIIEETVFRYGDAVIVTPSLEKEGYTFLGWFNENMGDFYVPDTMPAHDVTLVAEWKINEYDVEWINEGKIWKSETYEYGADITPPENPSREGYVFRGWNDSEDNSVEFPFIVTENISFSAVWEPIECTLVFDANGTEFSDGITEITETLSYGAAITVPENPCREGYYFIGWSTEPNSPYLVKVPDTMPDYDLYLYAVWEIAEYTVRFDDGFGNNFLMLTVSYGDDLRFVEYISCPNPENRNFLGWRDADTDEAFTLPATMPDRDVTLIAEWDYSEHTVIFDYNGGYDIDGNTEYAFTGYNGDYADVEEPMREGYTFAGWIDAEGNHVEMPYAITDRDVVITAMWEANIYRVIVDDGFGSHEVIGEYRYGEEIVLPVYDREGYTLAGWYNEYTGMFYEDGITMPAHDLEFVALWNVNQYTVRWIAEGILDEEITYEYGQEIAIPENPVKEGYVFAGWNPAVPQTMPANNIEFTAVWEALGSVTYTVETYTMNTLGEYNLSTTYHTAEQAGEVSVSPVIPEGFELNSNLSVLAGYAYPENELVLKIYIDRQSFTFTKIIDGNSYATEYLYCSIIAEPDIPVKEGYIFTGWDSEIPSTMPANDVTITAIFEVAEPEDIYNLGEETYSFRNFVDSDSSGHCFGMSSTSAGYHIGELAIEEIGGSEDSDLYNLGRTATVQAPICKYQAIQGSYSLYSTVAGGRYYKTKKYNISSDWEAVVNYVKNHEYDNKGTLQIGYRKDGNGGHAVNFLRYEEVDGQARIYAYDNNFPTKETYFYMDENGSVFQAPSSTFKGSIDCIALRSIPEYFNLADDFDTTRCIYADRDTIIVSGANEYSIDGNIDNSDVEFCEKVVFEIPTGVEQVTITSLVDNASFMYMGDEYSFGKVDDNNVGVLSLASSKEDGANDDSAFEITNGTVNISICNPSVTSISYGDRIILHADVSNIPEGGYVKWSASNGNFSYSVSSNGSTCVITPSSSGDTTFTATICDAKGNAVSSDNQTMTAKAGFFDKIIAFFKRLFGSTKIIMQNTDD